MAQKEVRIYDFIDPFFGVCLKSIMDDLGTLNDNDTIAVHINSGGGDVFEGYAIFNYLLEQRNKREVIIHIDGLAASIASVFAMAGTTVKMSKTAQFMIHLPSVGFGGGNADDLRKMADQLDMITEQIVEIYTAKTGQSKEQVREWVDKETWFTAEQALSYGFINEITNELTSIKPANTNYAQFRAAAAAKQTKPIENQMDIAKEFKALRALITNSLGARPKNILKTLQGGQEIWIVPATEGSEQFGVGDEVYLAENGEKTDAYAPDGRHVLDDGIIIDVMAGKIEAVIMPDEMLDQIANLTEQVETITAQLTEAQNQNQQLTQVINQFEAKLKELEKFVPGATTTTRKNAAGADNRPGRGGAGATQKPGSSPFDAIAERLKKKYNQSY